MTLDVWKRCHSLYVARDCLRLARRWRERGSEKGCRVAFELAMWHRAQSRGPRSLTRK